jgi:hypothetical protein
VSFGDCVSHVFIVHCLEFIYSYFTFAESHQIWKFVMSKLIKSIQISAFLQIIVACCFYIQRSHFIIIIFPSRKKMNENNNKISSMQNNGNFIYIFFKYLFLSFCVVWHLRDVNQISILMTFSMMTKIYY